MTTVQTSIDVDVPVRTAYNQWTQFEDFPRFMQAVEEVRQITDERLHWRARIAGVSREWHAEIVEQKPDQVVSWRSVDGAQNAGTVMFDPLTEDRTRISLRLDFDPETLTEKVGDALGFVQRQAEQDLEHFKEFIESSGHETGAWRGEIENGHLSDRERAEVGGHDPTLSDVATELSPRAGPGAGLGVTGSSSRADAEDQSRGGPISNDADRRPGDVPLT